VLARTRGGFGCDAMGPADAWDAPALAEGEAAVDLGAAFPLR
jgi:hypothetical protein